jgi:hypothetical protein
MKRRNYGMANTKSTLDQPRIRFNWGFHDGAEHRRNRVRNVSGHFDRIYAEGYRAGVSAAASGENTESSASAWKARRPHT